MKKEKPFKAVEFMRKRREELSELHNRDPEEYKRQLEAVQKKYKHVFKSPEKRTA